MNRMENPQELTSSESNSSFRVQHSALSIRPVAMTFFDMAAQQIADGLWPQELIECGRPIVAVLCNLTPLELIHAAGAMPVRLCAGATMEPRGIAHPLESKIQNLKSKIREAPRDLCQVVKGAAARLETLRRQTGRAPAAVIVPATCDWKTRCCAFLGLSDDACVLEVPRDKSSPRARWEWRQQIAQLADFLAHRLEACDTREMINRRSLLRSVALYQQASWLGRRLTNLMKLANPPIAGSDLMLVFNLFYSLPVGSWIAAASALLRQLEVEQASSLLNAGKMPALPDGGPSQRTIHELPLRPRLLLVGAPIIWPNWSLPRLIESLGGQIVADALCSGYRGFSDLVSVDETSRRALIEALADRYLLPCTCPCFATDEDYLRRAENQISDFHIEGVVIHRLKNCYLFDMEAKRLEDLFRKCGIPFLQIESDYESPAPASLTTRVEAFLDLVRQRKS